jgi:hypothetical protein
MRKPQIPILPEMFAMMAWPLRLASGLNAPELTEMSVGAWEQISGKMSDCKLRAHPEGLPGMLNLSCILDRWSCLVVMSDEC